MGNMISSGIQKALNISSGAARYLPEPASRGIGVFRDVMNTVSSVGKSAVGGVESIASGDFGELINLQIQVQKEMQTTTMVSNLEKTKHETKMVALRNTRVS